MTQPLEKFLGFSLVSRLEVFDELPQITTLVNNSLVGKSVHNKKNALILSFSLSNHLFYPFLYKYIPIWPRNEALSVNTNFS